MTEVLHKSENPVLSRSPAQKVNEGVSRKEQNVTMEVPTEYLVPNSPLPDEKRFTVVILTHDRGSFLRRALKVYANVTEIHTIIVYWNNPGRDIPDFHKDIKFKMQLMVTAVNLTSLNERFVPNPHIKTQGK